MKPIHGGEAKNNRIDANKIAVLLRSGMLSQAYVYPPALRAPSAIYFGVANHLMRKLLAHIQNTNSQYNLPEIGKKVAYKTNRDGVAEGRLAALRDSVEIRREPSGSRSMDRVQEEIG